MTFYIPAGGVHAIILGPGNPWQNQCGGHACLQKTADGELKKVKETDQGLEDFFMGEKWGGWCCDKIDDETADYIEAVVPVFKVDRGKMDDSVEAWILGSVDGKAAVLVWTNSD